MNAFLNERSHMSHLEVGEYNILKRSTYILNINAMKILRLFLLNFVR